MVTYKCVQKFRDKNNHIYLYKLVGEYNNIISITPKELKSAILKNEVNIVNLN